MLMKIPARAQVISPFGLVSLGGWESHKMKYVGFTSLRVQESTSRFKCTHLFFTSATASACAFLMTCWAYALNDGCAVCNNAIAITAAIAF